MDEQASYVCDACGEEIVIPDIRRTSYIVSRLRLMPSLQFGKTVLQIKVILKKRTAVQK